MKRALVALLLAVMVTAAYAGEKRIAVLPFRNLMKKPDLNWLSEGIAATITTKLGNIQGLALVERSQLQAALKEVGFQQGGLVDEQTAVKAGKILGVSVVVVGEFQVVSDQVRISARFVDVQTAKVISTADVTGSFQSIFSLQDSVAISLAKSLDLDVSEEKKKEMKSSAPTNLSAFEYYSKGADLYNKGNIEGAIEYYKKALEIDPNYESALFDLAYAYNSQKAYRQAIKYYTKVVNNNPKAKDALNNLGLAYYSLKDLENAEYWYKKAIQIDPNYSIALYNMGLIKEKQKDYALSVDYYERALRARPDYADAMYNMAYTYQKWGKYEEALRYYKETLEIDPEAADACNQIGLILETKYGNYVDAEEWYKRALQINPNYHLPYYNLGLLYSNKDYKNDPDQAIYYYQKAVAAKPDYDSAYYSMGILYTKMKEYDKAERAYQKAIDIYDKDPRYFNNLGWVYELKKNYNQAERYYREALRVNPSYKLGWKNLGYVLYYQKRDNEAIAAWKKAADLGDTGARKLLRDKFNINY